MTPYCRLKHPKCRGDRQTGSGHLLMSNSRKYILYTAYVIALSAVFLYSQFPSEKATAYLSHHLNRINADLTLSAHRIRPGFPPAIRVSGASLYHGENELLGVDRVTIAPKVMSYLADVTSYTFSGEAYDGRFGGKIDLGNDGGTGQLDMEVEFEGFQVNLIPAIQRLADRKISGRLGGNMVYTRKGSAGTANVAVTLSDGTIELQTPIPNMDKVTFKALVADLILSRDRLRIKKCDITGQQIEGSISGSIRLRTPFVQSTINLRGRLKPRPEFLSDLRKLIPEQLMPKKLLGKNGFPITLNGTLEKPGFLLR